MLSEFERHVDVAIVGLDVVHIAVLLLGAQLVLLATYKVDEVLVADPLLALFAHLAYLADLLGRCDRYSWLLERVLRKALEVLVATVLLLTHLLP